MSTMDSIEEKYENEIAKLKAALLEKDETHDIVETNLWKALTKKDEQIAALMEVNDRNLREAFKWHQRLVKK